MLSSLLIGRKCVVYSLMLISISRCDYRIESERDKGRQGDRQMDIRKPQTDGQTH